MDRGTVHRFECREECLISFLQPVDVELPLPQRFEPLRSDSWGCGRRVPACLKFVVQSDRTFVPVRGLKVSPVSRRTFARLDEIGDSLRRLPSRTPMICEGIIVGAQVSRAGPFNLLGDPPMELLSLSERQERIGNVPGDNVLEEIGALRSRRFQAREIKRLKMAKRRVEPLFLACHREDAGR